MLGYICNNSCNCPADLSNLNIHYNGIFLALLNLFSIVYYSVEMLRYLLQYFA